MAEQDVRTGQATETKRRRALVHASRALQPYGTPEEVQELLRRVKVMLPEAQQLKDEELLGLAQTSVLYGANPFPPAREVVWIPGKGATFGIRLLRRKGREWAEERELGYPDIQMVALVDAAEREQREIPPGALAYKAVGHFPSQRKAWTQDALTLRQALGDDAPYEVLLENIGSMPQVVAVGYVTREQMDALDNPRWYHKCRDKEHNTEGRNRDSRLLRGTSPCPDCGRESYAEGPAFSHDARARKRAEAAWWKEATDIPFLLGAGGEGVVEEWDEVPLAGAVVEGEVRPLSRSEQEALDGLRQQEAETKRRQESRTPEQQAAAAATAAESLYGPPEQKGVPTRPYPAGTVKARFLALAGDYGDLVPAKQQRQNVAMLLKECFETETSTDAEQDEARHRVQNYLTGKPSLSDWTGGELQAALKWLAAREDRTTGRWQPSPVAAAEARNCLEASGG